MDLYKRNEKGENPMTCMLRADLEFYQCQESQYWEALPCDDSMEEFVFEMMVDFGETVKVEEVAFGEENTKVEEEEVAFGEEDTKMEEEEYELIDKVLEEEVQLGADKVLEEVQLGAWVTLNKQRFWMVDAAIGNYRVPPMGDPYTSVSSSGDDD